MRETGVLMAYRGLRMQIGHWIFRRYGGNVAEFELRFLLLVLVALGFVGEHVGFHAAVVGFATGIALGEVLQDHETLEHKLKGLVFSLLAPGLLPARGYPIDLRELDLEAVLLTLVLLAATVGLK